MLFWGQRLLPVRTRLEISFSLPLRARLPLAVTVLCQGQIVRAAPAQGRHSLPMMGVTFRENHPSRRLLAA